MDAHASPLFPDEAQLPVEQDLSDHHEAIGRQLADATGKQLAAWLRPVEERLRVVENYVADQKARLPGVERECAAIRQNVEAVREKLERAAA